jgi:hypothetical protein
MRRLVFAALLGAACSHTETVKKPAAAVEAAAPARPARGAVSKENVAEGGAPVPRTPEGALAPGQLGKIHDKLVARGLLPQKSDKGDTLDDATRAALKKFQQSQKLPETGLPDHETVAKLGLDPDQVFAKAVANP